LEKQYEENRLRADLDLVEEAYCILLDKTLRDIAVAEHLLRESLVPFQALDERRILHREQFVEHLDGLRKLLVRHKIHTIKGADGKPSVGPLSPWREIEEALAADTAMSGPITFESRLAVIADLCRQLARTLRNLDPVVSADERATVSELLTCLETESTAFRRSGGNDSE